MRYFIHIRIGKKLYEDREGCEFPSLEAARHEAVQAVRGLLDSERCAELPEEQAFHIEGENGVMLMRLPFSSAFRLI